MKPEEMVKLLKEIAKQIEPFMDANGIYADSALMHIYDAISDIEEFD